jgi:hypothetical protein
MWRRNARGPATRSASPTCVPNSKRSEPSGPPPVSEPFDVNTPSPDEGHEAIRVAVLTAIDNSAVNVEEAYFLADVLFELVNGLTERIAALEATP